jgi:hypothetical protein
MHPSAALRIKRTPTYALRFLKEATVIRLQHPHDLID